MGLLELSDRGLLMLNHDSLRHWLWSVADRGVPQNLVAELLMRMQKAKEAASQ